MEPTLSLVQVCKIYIVLEILKNSRCGRAAVDGPRIGRIADKRLLIIFGGFVEVANHDDEEDEENGYEYFEYVSAEAPFVEEPVLIEEGRELSHSVL